MMLEKIKNIHYKKLFLYGFYISYIGITSIAMVIDMLIDNHFDALVDFISVIIAILAFRDYLVRRDEELASVILFWIASCVIFIFVLNSQFDISIIFTLLIPMVAFVLLSTPKMIFHVSIYFTFLLLIFTYGYLTYTAHPLLHGMKQMSSYVIAMLFVIAFGIFYHIAIEQYYRELETANRQKTFLLKEVHHRVKNNLNIISSILGLQKFETENQEVHRFIDQNRLRLESIALAHETLYKQEDLENINFKTYISKLTKHILTLEANHDGIVLEINSVPLKLSIDTIVQFGIIINELITNSIKYAFPDNKGKISIILKELDGGYLFRYSDDGIGLKEEEKVDGFGQSLIAMSTEQLGGELLLINKNGLSYEIKFKG